MQVTAQGGGYNAVYTARQGPEGWFFIEPGGTYLTAGIGKPMFYPTPEALLQAVSQQSGVRVTLYSPKTASRNVAPAVVYGYSGIDVQPDGRIRVGRADGSGLTLSADDWRQALADIEALGSR